VNLFTFVEGKWRRFLEAKTKICVQMFISSAKLELRYQKRENRKEKNYAFVTGTRVSPHRASLIVKPEMILTCEMVCCCILMVSGAGDFSM